MIKFRTLRADEIEARVSTINKNGCSLLLYKDARCDMNLLDETLGPLNWQRDHQMIGDRLYCTVSVWDENKNQWVSKTDVGTESYTEKEKGQASDSFKRACFNLGIGRELYTAPFIWIKASDFKLEERNGRFMTNDRFKVTSIGYDDNRRINSLQIVKAGRDNKVVYEFGNAISRPKAPADTSKPVLATLREREALFKLCQTVYVDYDNLLAKVGCTNPKTLTVEQHAAALNILRNTNNGS